MIQAILLIILLIFTLFIFCSIKLAKDCDSIDIK